MRSWKNTLLTRLFRPHTRPSSRPAPGLRFRPAVAGLEDRVVPAADAFADATVLFGSFATDVGYNDLAAAEDGEANLAHASGDINSVWWTWTAPASGRFEVNTFGSGIDTTLAVYTGATLDGLTAIDVNDDSDSGVSQSRVVFEAEAGETYHFAIDGVGGDIGEVYPNLGGAPANDDVGDATVVAGGDGARQQRPGVTRGDRAGPRDQRAREHGVVGVDRVRDRVGDDQHGR